MDLAELACRRSERFRHSGEDRSRVGESFRHDLRKTVAFRHIGVQCSSLQADFEQFDWSRQILSVDQ